MKVCMAGQGNQVPRSGVVPSRMPEPIQSDFPAAFLDRAPGKKATAQFYKILVKPGLEAGSRHSSTETDALTTKE